MNKEHNAASQRVKDLEDLKKQELEYQQYQKMLLEDDSKFNNLRQRLEMSQQSPTSRASSQSKVSSKVPSPKGEPNKVPLSKGFVQALTSEPSKQIESDESSLSNVSSASSKSVISINKQLAKQLQKLDNEIKPSSISFGSTNKGRKGKITTGKK
jgi:chromatin segregation and condensation protein Rec8/ScpA/Scc1 (kleisin family)